MNFAKVFVKGPPFKQITEGVFEDEGPKYKIIKSVEDADLVVFTRGEDINPSIYGEEPLPETYYSDRDISDLETLQTAIRMNKFLVGICRGAQLINCVPNGGSLWQDVDGHESSIHDVFDCVSGTFRKVNSVHHQMLRPTEEAEIVAWATESTIRKCQKRIWRAPPVGDVWPERDKDPEVVWYPGTKSFLFQGHPEFGHPPTTKYFFELLDKYYWGNV